jgi:hypothetical protein
LKAGAPLWHNRHCGTGAATHLDFATGECRIVKRGQENSEENEMHPQVNAFKCIAAQVSRLRGFRITEFMEDWGLEEILTEANENDHTATQIAAAVLWRFCCTDGKFNNFQVGLLAVVQYLKEQEEDIGTQPFHDLVAMMKAGTTKAAIEKWMETHFP